VEEAPKSAIANIVFLQTPHISVSSLVQAFMRFCHSQR